MKFKSLSNSVLHEETVLAAKTEKAATFALLEYLSEVDSRRLYSERGYSTLWLYVHQALGYSESAASERVSAVRLMASVPEVKAKIEREELTLTSAIKLAAFVKREECLPEKTVEILEMISGISTRKAEVILAREGAEPVLRRDHVKPAGPETTRVSFDADPEFMAMLERLKDLQGNPGLSICERLKAALQTEIARKENFARRRTKKVRSPSSSEPKSTPERARETVRKAASNEGSEPNAVENPDRLRAPAGETHQNLGFKDDLLQIVEIPRRSLHLYPYAPAIRQFANQIKSEFADLG